MKISDNAVGQEDDDHDQQDSEKRLMRHAQTGNGADQLRQKDHDDGSHKGTPECGHPADHHDHDRHDGHVVKGKDDIGVDIAHVVGVKRAGDTGQGPADTKRNGFIPGGIDPQGFRGILILADGHEIISQLGFDQIFDNKKSGCRNRQDDVIIIGFVDPRSFLNQNAEVSAGQPVHVLGGHPHDLAHGQGGQREKRPPEPQHDKPEKERKNDDHDNAQGNSPPRGELELVVQNTGCIGADAEIGRMAERNLSAVAGKKVPRHSHRRPHDHQHDHVQHVGAQPDQRQYRQ